MKKIPLLFVLLLLSLVSYSQLAWLQLPNFPGSGKRGLASFAINNMGYMGLGLISGGGGSTDWYQYDPGMNVWTQMASFPSNGRYGVVSFVIGSKGYIASGSTGSPTNQLWEYDATANTWTAKASLPIYRESAAGFSIGNKGYVGTGYLSGASYSDFYEYDPVTDAWTSKASFPGQSRNGASGFSIGTKGYMGMGNNTNSTANFQDFYEYDPGTDTWTQKADFTLPYVVEPTTYSSSSDGYVLCGYYYQFTGITHNPMNMLYKYSVSNNVWTLEGTFPGLPRGYAGGFSLSNDIYIAGGGQTNGLYDMITDTWKLSNGLTLRASNTISDIDVALRIGPNPATTYLRISTDINGQKVEKLRIYNLKGQLIKSVRYDNNEIELAGFATGQYFIEAITDKNRVLNGRFMKQ